MNIGRTQLSIFVSSQSARGVDEQYWPRERTAFLNAFRPVAARYRRRKRIGLSLFAGFMLGGFALTYVDLPAALGYRGFLLLAATWLAMVFVFAFGLRLRCPACRKRLEPAKGPYCPQCGSGQLEFGVHGGGCDGRIVEEDADSGRTYRIRGCTHCGVMLDERGV